MPHCWKNLWIVAWMAFPLLVEIPESETSSVCRLVKGEVSLLLLLLEEGSRKEPQPDSADQNSGVWCASTSRQVRYYIPRLSLRVPALPVDQDLHLHLRYLPLHLQVSRQNPVFLLGRPVAGCECWMRVGQKHPAMWMKTSMHCMLTLFGLP